MPDLSLQQWCRDQMVESAVLLNDSERRLVHDTIAKHAQHRGWVLHQVNSRTNHVHVVVASLNCSGVRARNQLKAWCTRRLKERQAALLCNLDPVDLPFDKVRAHWWTEGGFAKPLFTPEQLEFAVEYAGSETQNLGGSKRL